QILVVVANIQMGTLKT
ncbi:hypothetical protein JL09_g6929, partial [Pichia kudriavzevii]